MSTRELSTESRDGAGISRRAAIMRGGATGAAAAVLGTLGLRQRTLAQEMTPMAAPAGWKTQHVEVSQIPHDPVSITLAGSGPPQRGDHFYIDAPIYAKGDEGGARDRNLPMFRCLDRRRRRHIMLGSAADYRPLHPLQRMAAIMGLINEAGVDPNSHVGAVQGGSGAYAGAIGTFQQLSRTGTPVGVATPGGTPSPGPNVVDAVFDLLLPGQ